MRSPPVPRSIPSATWHVLVESLQRVPDLVRLLDAPQLLAAVCLTAADEPLDACRIRLLRAAAGTPRRQLARDLQLPSLKTLRRLVGAALTRRHLQDLAALRHDRFALRVLRHAPRITPVMLDALSDPVCRRQTAAGFHNQLACPASDFSLRGARLRRLCEFLGVYRPGCKLVSPRQAEQLYLKYGPLLRTHRRAVVGGRSLPSPPWPDEPDYAIALRTYKMLVQESVDMGNCCGSHLPLLADVRKGRSYLYRIEGSWGLPRATMEIVRDDDCWRIGIVQLRHGRRLDADRTLSLAVWLADRQGIADERECLPETLQPPRAVERPC